ncbi:MAG: hypothetical protein LBU87_04025, partial [Lactobacillales bacterium]|nr:hypothetical protein [Lactobacillales bacterium]
IVIIIAMDIFTQRHGKKNHLCHSGAGRNPDIEFSTWIPACAGMTERGRNSDLTYVGKCEKY